MKNIRRDFWIVFRKELRELLRDRRSLFWLFAPPIILPGIAICAAVFVGTQAIRLADEGVAVAVNNPTEAPALVERLADGDNTYLVDNEEDALIVVDIPDDFQEKLDEGLTANVELITRDSSVITLFASGAVRVVIEDYNRDLRDQRLDEKGVTEEWLQPISIGESRRAAESSVTGNDEDSGPSPIATIFLPLAVTSWLIGGGMGLVLDSTVGEKERQTIENILVTPANRIGIVLGKMTVIFLASMLVMSMWLTEGILLNGFSSAGSELADMDNPGLGDIARLLVENSDNIIGLVIALLAMIIPFTVMLNALVMAWCAYAANYREANLFMVLIQLGLPATVLLTVFSFPANVPELTYSVPLFGTIIAIRDLFSTTLSFTGLLINIISTIVYAMASITFAAWVFGREWSLTRGLQ